MRQRRATRTRGQDELLQLGQLRVVVRQGRVQRGHRLGLEQLKTGDGQLAAQIEQLVLHLDQHVTHVGRHVFAQQHANVGVELVHLAHGVHTQTVFGYAQVVAQTRRAVVAGAGGNLRQTLAHKSLCKVRLKVQSDCPPLCPGPPGMALTGSHASLPLA